jgi:hypothetical protein
MSNRRHAADKARGAGNGRPATGNRPPPRDPFRLPSGGYGYPAASGYVSRSSLRDILRYFSISLDPYGTKLVRYWDREPDEFYLLAVRAIGAWADYVIALPSPVMIPKEELGKRRSPNADFVLMQHHAYFEATLALGDGLAAGLAGYPRPALATLRTFVESAITEVYIHGDPSGRRLWDYLRYLEGHGHRPRYRQMLDAIFAEPRFAAVGSFREQVDALNRTISASAHARTPDEGLLEMRAGNSAVATFPELVFWLSCLGMAVHRMLTLLVLRFPMALFPVDLERRFGYNPPVGMLSDEVVSASIREGLGARHARALTSFLRDDEEVQGLLDWYKDRPELADSEIDADWERSRREPRSKSPLDVPRNGRWALLKAEMAAMQWASDMGLAMRLVPPEDNIDPGDILGRSILAVELRRHYGSPEEGSEPES